MKRFYIIQLLILALCARVSAGNYDDFLKAWNAKDYPKALVSMKKAYLEKPGDPAMSYWYGIVLFQNTNYSECIAVLNKVPSDYIPLSVSYYIVQCYLKTGQREEAAGVLKKAVFLDDDGAKFKQYLFAAAVDNLIVLKDTKGLEETLNGYEAYMKINPGLNYTYQVYLVAKYYQSLAVLEGTNGNIAQADKWAAKSAEYAAKEMGTYAPYYDRFAYAYCYVSSKNYPKAISLYESYPPAELGLKDIWYYAESLKITGKSQTALQIVKKGLKTYKKGASDDQWLRWNYFHIIRLCTELKDLTSFAEYEKEIVGFFAKLPGDESDWVRYSAANIYLVAGFDFFGTDASKGYFDKVKKYYDMGLGKYQNLIRMSDIRILGETLKYWDKNYNAKKDSAYRLDMLFWFWGESDGTWKSLAGTNLTVKKTLDKSVTNDLIKSFNVFRMFYFYLSDGQILPQMDIRFIDATATVFTQSVYLSPINGGDGKPVEDFPINYIVEEKIPGFPWEMIYETRNKYDVFCSVFPFGVSSGISSYGGQNIVPFIKQTKIRGGMRIADVNLEQPWTMIHEFFHNVEATYRTFLGDKYAFTPHMFRDTFKNYWPSWYHGEGELTYYKLVFDRFVLPTGCDKMHYKQVEDVTSTGQIEKYWKFYKSASLSDLKIAYQYKNSAIDKYHKGEKDAAFELYQKSYKLFPYFADVNEMLGLQNFQKQDYSNSYPYYLQAMAYDETNRYRLTMAAFLADKLGDWMTACGDYLTAYEKYGGDPGDLYYAARIYYTAKDYENSAKYLQKLILAHPGSDMTKYALHLLSNIHLFYIVDYPKAKELLDKYYLSVKDTETLKYLAVNYAIALGETGSKKEALKLLDAAKKYGADPKTVDFYRNKYQK
ncbi:MAG: hypothetical protein A2Y33_12080 [Spirochaetes bacterium GWF1_51_8]|nr:MAG: hypothetical protein A2Y33_12080 [Spirochaetes bacterium GWF1_51_8]